MTTSQTQFLSEISSEEAKIPPGKLAYLQARLRNNLYSFVIGKFRDRERQGFTKARLARRIGYDPARVTKLLGAPGNWTLDTVSDLFVGICAEELVLNSRSFIDQPKRNYAGQEWWTDATSTIAEIKPRKTPTTSSVNSTTLELVP